MYIWNKWYPCIYNMYTRQLVWYLFGMQRKWLYVYFFVALSSIHFDPRLATPNIPMTEGWGWVMWRKRVVATSIQTHKAIHRSAQTAGICQTYPSESDTPYTWYFDTRFTVTGIFDIYAYACTQLIIRTIAIYFYWNPVNCFCSNSLSLFSSFFDVSGREGVSMIQWDDLLSQTSRTE